mmetsp:Transcript_96749/g.311831  ORF Transcript_96749/g.311831 Transcript_96749/m.311831 type:complete len:483 (+) Transcript_96749:2678-4126(+)
MQRFEQLQPGLTRIPQGELQPFLIESQALHERFLELQAQSQTTGPSALEAWQQQRLLPFRDDLAAFVERVETRLGTQPQGGIPQCGGGGVGALGAASFGQQPSGAFGASSFGQQPRGAIPDGPTNLRLQSSMQKIQGGMQRFEALHPQLRNADPQLFNRVADRGQQLHEEFMELQRTGVELESSNTPSHQADMEAYLARLDRFVPGMLDFVTGVEDSLRNSGGGGRQMGSFGSSSPGFGGAGGVPPVSPGMPQRAFAASGGFGGAGAAGVGAGSITPATDQSLSGVIQQLTDLMQEFQAMRPQISQLPPSRLAPVGQQGEVLDERFRQLQLRGAAIAGDGTQPMMEADAVPYLAELENFAQEQRAYVDTIKQVVRGAGGHAAPTSWGGAGGGGGLPPARPPGAFGSAAAEPPRLGGSFGAPGEDLRHGGRGADVGSRSDGLESRFIRMLSPAQGSKLSGVDGLDRLGKLSFSTTILPAAEAR